MCTTVGQVDDNAIYYLRTRDIPARVAERMLTSAFAADVLRSLRLEGLQALLRDGIESQLDQVIGD